MIEARQTIQEVMRAEAVKFSGFAFNVSAKVSATQKRAPEDARKWLILKIGARGFEPPTSRSQTERTTRLCYAPNKSCILRVRPEVVKHTRSRGVC